LAQAKKKKGNTACTRLYKLTYVLTGKRTGGAYGDHVQKKKG